MDLPTAELAIALLSSGGDARITLAPESGLNRYFSSPYPRDVLAYASSTANDISRPAFAHVCGLLSGPLPDYATRLEAMRGRLRRAYGLGSDCEIVFAASGTDLEYVALAAVAGCAAGGVHNILLGANEVGSGCIHSGHGRYFADTTARGVAVSPAQQVPGLEAVSLTDIPVRDEQGVAQTSAQIAVAIEREIEAALAADRHALVHVVHGSKTGLILPGGAELKALAAKWQGRATFVVDACQARLSESAAQDYLASGCILFITGSKFMGGPPFSGMAVVPAALVASAAPLPAGLATVFRRAEFPAGWAGSELLPDEDNPGLALRLEAAIFELERYHALAPEVRTALTIAFHDAVIANLLEPLGLAQILPHHPDEPERGYAHPTAMMSLLTLAVTSVPGGETFEQSAELHRRLIGEGIRLGQPVKCVRLADGGWGGTLRVGLSMPQVSALAKLPLDEARARLDAEMQAIASAISRAG
ncbi:MAG: hypothetical protein JY451_13195 [Erythrobacter sp.]|nr:MAG: hypothetical protein JY451_13195 [Erythrobacter sp.]